MPTLNPLVPVNGISSEPEGVGDDVEVVLELGIVLELVRLGLGVLSAGHSTIG